MLIYNLVYYTWQRGSSVLSRVELFQTQKWWKTRIQNGGFLPFAWVIVYVKSVNWSDLINLLLPWLDFGFGDRGIKLALTQINLTTIPKPFPSRSNPNFETSINNRTEDVNRNLTMPLDLVEVIICAILCENSFVANDLWDPRLRFRDEPEREGSI